MGVNSVVKVHCRRGSTSLLAKGKGAHCEVGSEGSRRQSHGSMNKNQGAAEYMGRARGELNVLTWGDLPDKPGKAGNPC